MDITVRARAQGARDPDYALLVLIVSVEDPDVQRCLQATTDLVVELQDDLTRLRSAHPGALARVVISPISTRSWRPWNDQGTQLPLCHSATSRVEVEVRDHGLLGQVSRRWGARAGVVVEAPEWELDQGTRDELVTEVTTAAVHQARARAQVMAEASGFSQVHPVQVADTGLLATTGEYPHAGGERAMAMHGGRDADAIDLTPRPVRVEVVVEARFQAG